MTRRNRSTVCLLLLLLCLSPFTVLYEYTVHYEGRLSSNYNRKVVNTRIISKAREENKAMQDEEDGVVTNEFKENDLMNFIQNHGGRITKEREKHLLMQMAKNNQGKGIEKSIKSAISKDGRKIPILMTYMSNS